jgi:small-conductance mechanosensitive channel
MGINNRKQSGLDIEALNAKMNALGQKAEKEKEVQQEAVNLQELAEELRLVASDVRHLVPKVRELSASIERAGQQLEEAGKEGDMTYSLFQCALVKANAEGIKIEASAESLNALNSQCNTIKDAIIGELKKKLDTSNSTFISDHKTNLDELARVEKQQLLTFRCDINNALSHYGFWCSSKVFLGILSIFGFCLLVTVLTIILLIAGNLQFRVL